MEKLSKEIVKRIDSKEIVKKMSPELRKKIVIAAKEEGMSAEDFVRDQLVAQLADDDLMFAPTSLEVGETAGPEVRVGGDVRGGPGERIGVGGRVEARFPIRIRIGRRRRR